MPTYAYACTACEHRFEIVQSFTDDSLTECPECAGRLRKLFNAVGVVFKGSGFYSNDSRRDSADPRHGRGKSSRHGAGGTGGNGDSGKSDHGGSGSPSGESSGSSADSSSSTAAASAGSAGTTKTAAKTASKSEGAAA